MSHSLPDAKVELLFDNAYVHNSLKATGSSKRSICSILSLITTSITISITVSVVSGKIVWFHLERKHSHPFIIHISRCVRRDWLPGWKILVLVTEKPSTANFILWKDNGILSADLFYSGQRVRHWLFPMRQFEPRLDDFSDYVDTEALLRPHRTFRAAIQIYARFYGL